MSASLYDIGEAAVLLSQRDKQADARPPLSYAMKGKLYLSNSGWLLLDVPNAIGNGAFQALDEPGVEQPKQDSSGQYNAHISVARPEELESIGGPDGIKERGQMFGFNLGVVRKITPHTWDGVSKCWALEAKSPGLMELRRNLGLGPPQYPFHVTFAIRKKKRRQPSMIHMQKAAARSVRVGESAIHGKGLFAAQKFSDGDIIVDRLMTVLPDNEDGKHVYEQSDDARYTNHSDSPNTEIVKGDGYVQMRALRDIVSGEELTADYVRTTNVLGPLKYQYKGKPYGEPKQAGSVYMNAINQTPFQYDHTRGVLDNLVNHVGAVKHRGDRAISEAAAQDRLANAADPDRSMRQLSSYLSGQRKPLVHHPLDRFLQGVR